MGEQAYLEPSDILCEGDSVKVRVINIDAEARRLGLSLRSIKEEEEQSESSEAAQPSEPVSSL
jgi:small subunit ribosomal protein S1